MKKKEIPHKQEFNKILDYLLIERKSKPHISFTPTILSQYYKNFQLLNRLRGSALCLLKTQFAKKPKNPV